MSSVAIQGLCVLVTSRTYIRLNFLSKAFLINLMEDFIGVIKLFAGDFAPKGWMICNGSLIDITSNPALFSVIGNRYGGDQRAFALPDLRSRVPVGVTIGSVPGGLPTVQLADKKGVPSAVLTAANLPNFTAPVTGQVNLTGTIAAKIKVNNAASLEPDPTGHYIAQNETGNGNFSAVATPGNYLNDDAVIVSHNLTVAASGLQTSYSGAANPISTMPPYLGLNYIICVEGYYPPRP
jgi:microcystin-dependent protein